MSTNRTDRLTGWIDERRRPLINLHILGDEIACALVDTGFNGYLLWEDSTDNLLEFPGELSQLYESIEVAGGKILVAIGVLSIKWFDEADFTAIETLVSISAKKHRPGDPAVFVGTSLLSGKMLFVDFLNGTLLIETSK